MLHSNKANKIIGIGLGTAPLMRRRFGLQKAGPRNRSDQRAELMLGALACVVLALIAGMIVFVFAKAWPSFSHNGLDWFNPGGRQRRRRARLRSSTRRRTRANYVYTMHAWPLIYATALITARRGHHRDRFRAALRDVHRRVRARRPLRRVLEPVVRLLAAVPSVIYGLIGILVIVPFVGNHLISQGAKDSVAGVIQLERLQLGRRRPDPDGDDHADHDRDRRRCPPRRAASAGVRAPSRSA